MKDYGLRKAGKMAREVDHAVGQRGHIAHIVSSSEHVSMVVAQHNRELEVQAQMENMGPADWHLDRDISAAAAQADTCHMPIVGRKNSRWLVAVAVVEHLSADNVTADSRVRDHRLTTAAVHWTLNRRRERKAGMPNKLYRAFGDSSMPGDCIAETKQRCDDSRSIL